MDFLTFDPIYQKRVWGGRNLDQKLGRKLPLDIPVGESWEIVDRPEAVSIVAEGSPFEGLTLRAVLESNDSAKVMGPSYSGECPFPVLVKWLDCQERLSLQVHPPAAVAEALKGEPKSENWYIFDTKPGAGVLVGLKRGVTREAFEEALNDQSVEQLLHRCATQPGDSMFVPSGRIHGIDAGNLILEIQQNSDTTYRVYDWNRMGLDGKPRQLHVDASLKSIDFKDFEPSLLSPVSGTQLIVDCAAFRIRKFDLRVGGAPLTFAAREQPRLVHVVRGQIKHKRSSCLKRGQNALLPYASKFCFRADRENATVLVTDNFVLNP